MSVMQGGNEELGIEFLLYCLHCSQYGLEKCYADASNNLSKPKYNSEIDLQSERVGLGSMMLTT